MEPLKPPKAEFIENTLEAKQQVVGGTISCTYPWEDMVGLIHNDNGIAGGLPLNRMLCDDEGKPYDIVPGTFLIAGLTEDDFCSLTEEQVQKFTEKFRYPEMYMRSSSGEVFCFFLGSDRDPVIIC